MSQDPEEPKIYLLPNLMTAGNLLCGFLAILTIFKGMQVEDLLAAKPYYQQALLYIFGSCLFDLLDGRLARLGGKESPFGQEFDSLADMVSFGLAPAMLVSSAVLSDFQLPESFDPSGKREGGSDLGFCLYLPALRGDQIGSIQLSCVDRFNER